MTNKFFYVYVLLSKKDGKFYIGSTKNLKVRFSQHNKGQVTSTSYRRPFKLIYYEAGLNLHDARERETYLKTTYGHRYIRKRLKSYFTG